MKKFLLSLLAVAGLSFAASAEQSTFDFSNPSAFGYELSGSGPNANYDPEKPLVSGDVTITCDTKDATGTSMLRFYGNPSDFRCGDGGGDKKQTLTFTAKGGIITEIVFSASKIALTVNVGELGKLSNGSATWTGSATEVVFTTKKANTFKGVTVTYTPSNPDLKAANLSFGETTEYTVIRGGETFTAPELTYSTNAAISYESSDPAVASVDANTGAVEIKGVGTTMITASSEANAEYNAGSASYTITVLDSYNTLADFYTVGDGNYGFVNFDLIVTYVKGKNCYVVTREGEAGLLFGDNSYAAGNVIPAGWKGEYDLYGDIPEIKGTFPASTESVAVPAPAEVTEITADDINKIVVIKNVVFAEATKGEYRGTFNGTVSTESEEVTTIKFYNSFTVASVEAGTYDVKAAVSSYEGDIQAYPIEFTEAVSTGIDGVVVDENAPAEYYNLQGVRVANPGNGLFIRRQGNKAVKVLVK